MLLTAQKCFFFHGAGFGIFGRHKILCPILRQHEAIWFSDLPALLASPAYMSFVFFPLTAHQTACQLRERYRPRSVAPTVHQAKIYQI